jgi:ABC-type Fe3+-hydroxamate transport system substrate-binding protein
MPLSSIDQLGHEIKLHDFPRRIISLVPSQTELLFDLGLQREVVGITKFCVHPSSWATKTNIGGTKNFWFDVIDGLKPDLIIGNKEENYREGIEILKEQYPVWVSDIFNLQDALSMIEEVGRITQKEAMAASLVSEIAHEFSGLYKMPPRKVLYVIWRNPWMAVGSNTFIHEMLVHLGLVNCIANKPRYPELSLHDIASLQPDYILLSSEPFPFQQKHIEEMQEISPSSTIMLVDGEMFSWYGSRLRKAPAYFRSLNFV